MSRYKRHAVAIGLLGVGGFLAGALWVLAFAGGREAGGDSAQIARRELAARPAGTDALIERLRRTNLLNGDEIRDQLCLAGGARARGFLTHSPYGPRHPQLRKRPDALQEACAVQFVDSTRVDYRLRTFPDPGSAVREGYVVTHHRRCGTCSSLSDLAVYVAKPDLTTAARTCARRLTAGAVKACLMEEVGLGEHCAETWTYNVLHTRRQCAAVCIKHYGLWSVLTNDMGDAHADERGVLNPCLACDEYTSGPGFQYAAGRTRRASGLLSAINRAAAEIHSVDHRLYFR